MTKLKNQNPSPTLPLTGQDEKLINKLLKASPVKVPRSSKGRRWSRFIGIGGVLFFLVFLVQKVDAQHFVSDSYIIDWGNFNSDSGKKSSPSYELTDTVGQNAPGPYTSTDYIIKSGFQYIYNTFNKFSFHIDNLSIALGTLVPGIGTSATNNLTISTPSGHGYQVMVAEIHPLQIQGSGITVPDTKCDSGTCSISTSGVWVSSSVYGFGFNVIGTNSSGVVNGVGTSSYFTDSTYYRPFANMAGGQSNQVVMSESSPIQNHYARVTYKANISTLQSSGNYQTGIIFTAVPNY